METIGLFCPLYPVIQWLTLCPPSTRDPGSSIPSKRTRSHVPELRPSAANFFKKKHTLTNYNLLIKVWKWKSSVVSNFLHHIDYIVSEILQARIMAWAAIPFSSRSSQPGDRTQVSHIAGRFFTVWATYGGDKTDRKRPCPRPLLLLAAREFEVTLHISLCPSGCYKRSISVAPTKTGPVGTLLDTWNHKRFCMISSFFFHKRECKL